MRKAAKRIALVCAGLALAFILLVVGLAVAGVGSNDPRSRNATTAAAGGHSLAGSPAASIPGVPAPSPSPKHHGHVRVSFVVTGNAPGASITYGSDTDDRSVNGTLGMLGDMAPVPWAGTMRFDPTASYYSIDAQLEDGGHITCRIVVKAPGYQALVVATGHASGNGSICDAQAAPNDASGHSWYQE